MVGEPAGGSLTADQWMILATVIGPLVVSFGLKSPERHVLIIRLVSTDLARLHA